VLVLQHCCIFLLSIKMLAAWNYFTFINSFFTLICSLPLTGHYDLLWRTLLQTCVFILNFQWALLQFVTRQAIHVWRHIEARSLHHCGSEKAITINYIFWLCICSTRYPSRNAQWPYCHPWPVWLYRIFPHYLINGWIFEINIFWT
jgi:hypothetical protein